MNRTTDSWTGLFFASLLAACNSLSGSQTQSSPDIKVIYPEGNLRDLPSNASPVAGVHTYPEDTVYLYTSELDDPIIINTTRLRPVRWLIRRDAETKRFQVENGIRTGNPEAKIYARETSDSFTDLYFVHTQQTRQGAVKYIKQMKIGERDSRTGDVTICSGEFDCDLILNMPQRGEDFDWPTHGVTVSAELDDKESGTYLLVDAEKLGTAISLTFSFENRHLTLTEYAPSIKGFNDMRVAEIKWLDLEGKRYLAEMASPSLEYVYENLQGRTYERFALYLISSSSQMYRSYYVATED